MDKIKRISEAFNSAEQILFDDSSKIVLMSDCHRGNGSWADDFAGNENIYYAALKHYNREKYTYIELGDGDELWENKNLQDILTLYSHIFLLMSEFYKEGRLYLLYGNHDLEKRNGKNLYDSYYDERIKKNVPLMPNIKIHESLILKHKHTGNKLYLLHGHQGDLINDQLWKLGRFLVRYIWNTLELIGINNPFSASKNNKRKLRIEQRLMEWSESENKPVIAGHTHRARFPDPSEAHYFNDGCCVHRRQINAIEIYDGCIVLVKWSRKTKDDGTLYIGRDIVEGPVKLTEYYE